MTQSLLPIALSVAPMGPATAEPEQVAGHGGSDPPPACRGIQEVRRGDAVSLRRHLRGTGRKVLTFVGYSGAGYEDPEAMRQEAAGILDRHDPRRTLVNSGATAEGIGVVAELARVRGFATIGIVSELARQQKVPLSPCVAVVFFVPDRSWGGELPGGGGLSPTSEAVVRFSDALVGIGGGPIARDELLAARRAGKPVTFIPADMNHTKARQKAARQGQPEPASFRGEAAAVLAPE